jgi:lysozyme family protein
MTRDQIIALVIKLEGGLVDNPADPGGRTNMGITQRYLDARRHARMIVGGLPIPDLPATVDALTLAQVTWFYQTDQWRAVRGDDIPPALAALAFDAAVNEGPGTAVMLLQQALGVTVDQKMGPATVMACHDAPAATAAEYAARRAAHYASLNKGVFELGWMRRLITVYTAAVNPG